MLLFGLGLFLGAVGGIIVHSFCADRGYDSGHRDGYHACWRQMLISQRVVQLMPDRLSRVGKN